MNIGIDIDGVLTNYERDAIDYGTKMSVEEKWPIDIDVSKYLEINAFKWNKEQAQKFVDKYFVKYLKETPVRAFAPEVIERLKHEGNKIYLITARHDEEMPQEYYGEIQDLTKQWLKKQNIKYDEIIFKKNKLQPCIENKIDIMIEDSPQNIEDLSKQIKVIKFDCQYNKDVNNENIITAYSWYHIYKIIKEMEGK
mgnify:CR=1 FL=1